MSNRSCFSATFLRSFGYRVCDASVCAIPTSLQGDQNGPIGAPDRWDFVVFDPASHSKASTRSRLVLGK
jgi:hypothetical protein